MAKILVFTLVVINVFFISIVINIGHPYDAKLKFCVKYFICKKGIKEIKFLSSLISLLSISWTLIG
jgi:hypothetical protein